MDNTQAISNCVKKHFSLISWSFHSSRMKEKKGTGRKKVWVYPMIQTMSGVTNKKNNRGFFRSYKNGNCHAEITDDDRHIFHVFFSRSKQRKDEMYYEYKKSDLAFSKKSVLYLSFSSEYIISKKWNNLNFVAFIVVENREATLYKVDWQSIKNFMKEKARQNPDDDYVKIEASKFEAFKEYDIPSDYKPDCYFERLDRAITDRFVWQNEKTIILRNLDGNEIEFLSIEELWNNINETGIWKCSTYGSFRKAKCLNNPINSKDKKLKMIWSLNSENIDILSIVPKK